MLFECTFVCLCNMDISPCKLKVSVFKQDMQRDMHLETHMKLCWVVKSRGLGGGELVARKPKFSAVAPNISGSLVRNWHHVPFFCV